jgi:hypothetical protein
VSNQDYRHAIGGLKGKTLAIIEIAGKAWDAGLVKVINGLSSDQYVDDVALASVRTLFWADATFYRIGTDETVDTRHSQMGDGVDEEFSADDLDSSDWEKLRDDAESFVRSAWPWLILRDVEPAHAGHDLHLTRNHHGAGFWDGNYGPAGDALTEAAHLLSGGVGIDIGLDDEDESASFQLHS